MDLSHIQVDMGILLVVVDDPDNIHGISCIYQLGIQVDLQEDRNAYFVHELAVVEVDTALVVSFFHMVVIPVVYSQSYMLALIHNMVG